MPTGTETHSRKFYACAARSPGGTETTRVSGRPPYITPQTGPISSESDPRNTTANFGFTIFEEAVTTSQKPQHYALKGRQARKLQRKIFQIKNSTIPVRIIIIVLVSIKNRRKLPLKMFCIMKSILIIKQLIPI